MGFIGAMTICLNVRSTMTESAHIQGTSAVEVSSTGAAAVPILSFVHQRPIEPNGSSVGYS
ncbi:hypothetical protein [Nocardia fusca]|uniref:Uncharacterized protein n=1 Tax=Nocardia fusca TaxID=941183 RepID=A0ABV3FAC3_9NOCA